MGRQIKTIPGSDTAVAMCDECADQLQAHKLTPEEIAMIKPGAWVKVNDNNEGFFVKVTEVKGDKIIGIVDNILVHKHDFQYGDTLEIELREIYQVVPGED